MKVRNKQQELESPDEAALGFVIRSIKNETEKVWTLTGLFEVYVEKGGAESHIYRFTNTVMDRSHE